MRAFGGCGRRIGGALFFSRQHPGLLTHQHILARQQLPQLDRTRQPQQRLMCTRHLSTCRDGQATLDLCRELMLLVRTSHAHPMLQCQWFGLTAGLVQHCVCRMPLGHLACFLAPFNRARCTSMPFVPSWPCRRRASQRLALLLRSSDWPSSAGVGGRRRSALEWRLKWQSR